MEKSILVQRMESYAAQCVQAIWPNSKATYISIEFILVAILKIADPATYQKEFHKFDKMTQQELQQLQITCYSKKLFTMTRDELRNLLPLPDAEADNTRLEYEAHACQIAKQNGEALLTTNAYLQAILERPTKLIRSAISVRADCSAPQLPGEGIQRLFSLAELKRQRKENLRKVVVGQEDAVNAFVEGITACYLTEAAPNNNRPKGIFLFAGPPGVGKTFLAEKGAEELGLPSMRFDMSEYADEEDAVFRLIGTDPVWRGKHEGELTAFVHKCNMADMGCVLIFDEIEKAHLNVIHLFLQILDAGRLTDKFTGKTANFREAFIVFTTNAGRSLYEDGKQPPRNCPKSVIMDALRDDVNPKTHQRFFPEAILSRMGTGYTVMFRHLAAAELVSIGAAEMHRQASAFQEQYGPEIIFDKGNELLPFLLLLTKGGESDARSFRAECEKFIRGQLFSLADSVPEETVSRALRKNNRIRITVDGRDFAKLQAAINPIHEPEQMLLIAEDEEDLERYAVALKENGAEQLFLCNSYSTALKDLKAGKYAPTIILAALPGSDRPVGATESFAQKAPLIASFYQEFRTFLEKAAEELPEVPIAVLYDQRSFAGTRVASDLQELGASFLLDCKEEDVQLADEIFALKNRAVWENLAYRFSRERKGLTFTASPNEENGTLCIRAKNFQITRLVSGADSSSLITEDRMPAVTFDDYIGGDDIKEEMKEFITFLQNPRTYTVAHGDQPKGILLYGPPGTGKTFFAKALAHEAGVPFFAANGSEFVTEYAGSGPKAIRALFAKARKYAPAIIFIDEIDAIGKKRTGDSNQRAQEETLNMLLTEMDGFGVDAKRPVFLIGATNFGIDQNSSTSIDAALVRRFTRTVLVDLPNQKDRLAYLRHKLKEIPHRISDMFLESVARRSVGMNYGSINNVIEKAARDARAGDGIITEDILDNALETILYGEKKDWGIDALERTAWHEAGHAYMNWLCGQTPEYITITARGDFGGYVLPANTEGKACWTKAELLERVKVSLAGRAAELLRYGTEDGLSTGPAQDLRHAGQLLTEYVCSFGMDDQLGLVYVPDVNDPPHEVCERIHTLLQEQQTAVLEVLTQQRETLQRFVNALLAANKLTAQEIERILEGDHP